MFQRKTVQSVVASFQKTIDDLNEINNRENQNVDRINVEIAQLEAEKQNSLEEGNAAIAIASKIRKLISA
jgi:hypothetical protein